MHFKNIILKVSKHILNNRLKSNWIQPTGYDTSIKVYNCTAQDKVPLIVRNKNYVTWYTCGPTVYDSAHIGHASCYVKLDILQRILKNYFNLNIVTVLNITDIDDKIINKSTSLNVHYSEITKKYEKEFFEDLNYLNVSKPSLVIRVTENIPLIKDFIKKLMTNEKAYVHKDGTVYFELNKYNLYGKLQNIGQTENSEKKSAGDFALWKGVKPNEPFWEAEWGSGRPGWHIECSAMASAVFGQNLDIHAGGIDLRFPHHENEEAQSCAHFDTKQWVNYWFHTGHLHLSHDKKMSKSIGNTVTIHDLAKNTSSDVFRMACTMSHYRANMEFSSEILQTAETYVNKIKSFLNDCDLYFNGYLPKAKINEIELINFVSHCDKNILEALKDDFNTAKVMKTIIELISFTNKMFSIPAEDLNFCSNGSILMVSNFINEQLNNLGFQFDQYLNAQKITESDNVLNILNDFRQNVRNYALENKDKNMLKFCDNVRNELKAEGVNLQDFGKKSSWSRM